MNKKKRPENWTAEENIKVVLDYEKGKTNRNEDCICA